MDDLGLVETVDRFGQSIVVAVADAADGGFKAGLGEALGVLIDTYWADSNARRNTILFRQ